MKFKKFNMCWLVFFLMLSACATLTQDQAMKTVGSKYPEALFVYVDAPDDAISSALMAAHLKITSSTTSDVLVKMLLLSDKTPAAVAGSSDIVTAATIRRGIDDAGARLPKNGQLIIIGETKSFEDTVNFAKSRGLNVDVMLPVKKDGSAPILAEPAVIAPPIDQLKTLQNQMQKDTDAQMNQLLQNTKTKR